MRTFAEFAGDLTGMSVTGIKRVYTAPPESLSTANLPALFPMLPEGEQAPLTFGASEYGGSRSLELWVPIKPSAQGTLADAYAAMTAMMDALDTALRALDVTVPYRLTWAIRGSLLTIADIDYRGAVVTATAEED
jgi:hypothetical protein